MNDPIAKQDRASCRFLTTQWTHVLSARGETAEAKQSLKELCDRYYAPVYAFVESYSHHDQNARDWTHAFFAKVLEGRSLDSVIQSRGRFRSYLLGAVKHFLADEREKDQASKRGGLVSLVSVDQVDEFSLTTNTHYAMPPDAAFDRQWAMSILQHSLKNLEEELGEGQATRFELLRPWLSGEPIDRSHADVAVRLGVSIEVVKITIHRWRKRFREIVKGHIASTVSDSAEVEEELGYLIQALSHPTREA